MLSILLASIETPINSALRLDPDSLARLAALSGTCVAIELQILNSRVYIKPTADGLSLDTASDKPPDATIAGTPISLLRMMIAPNDTRLVTGGEVQLLGDIELGQRLQGLIQHLDIDWEELLSRYTGDFLARPIGNGARYFKAWSQEATAHLGQDLAEYLHEEARLLPNRNEVTPFLDSVDRLRADADRLEARIQRLRRQR